MTLYLLDPIQPGAAWAPYAGTLPLGELRAGAWRLHERWQRALGGSVAGHIARHAAGARPAKAIPVVAAAAVSGPAWVVDSTFSPKLPMRAVGGAKRLLSGGRAVAWRLDAGESWTGPHNDGDGIVIEGLVLRGAFDLITALEQQLFTDLLGSLDGKSDPIPDGVVVFGNPGAIALHGAILEPGVILDARKGAIILERGVEVRAGTRIEGPARVDHDSFLLGGQLRHVSVGPHCRIHGEISTTVFQGYANKSHDGFLGHSVVGEWVNLGAGTITFEPQEHLRPDPPRHRHGTGGDGAHQPRHALRRSCQDRDRHADADRRRGRHRRQSLRCAARPEVGTALCVGRRRRRAALARGVRHDGGADPPPAAGGRRCRDGSLAA
ncbi:MAG: hypothetical protein V9E87_02465 [Gemmatimonadales bacterium]